MVTIAYWMSIVLMRFGIAVISFDFSSVLICPKTIPSLEAHALTI